MLAPLEIMSDAAVCRRSCILSPGSMPAASSAGAHTGAAEVRCAHGPTLGCGTCQVTRVQIREVRSELVGEPGWCHDGSRAVGFGCTEHQLAANLRCGFGDRDSPSEGVHVGCPEGGEFAPAKADPGEDVDDETSSGLVLFGGVGEVGDLVGVEEALLAWSVGGDLDAGDGVAAEDSVGDGGAEGGAEELARLADPRCGETFVGHLCDPLPHVGGCDATQLHGPEDGEDAGSQQRLVAGAGLGFDVEAGEPGVDPCSERHLPGGGVDPQPAIQFGELVLQPAFGVDLAGERPGGLASVGGAVAGAPRRGAPFAELAGSSHVS